ncbi:YhcH/YjgK/YiaL family protein [Paenibacillus sp. SAF-054]|uniref:YhcH/YjgK/YiaL family protein n=1 Tax=unclassified Paenibacillus TaxID=185978 RepID=UPI003F81B3F0
MIFDKISNAAQYMFLFQKWSGLRGAVEDMLRNINGGPIETSLFKKNLNVFQTMPKPHLRYEAHRQYIDIHVVLEGREYVEISNVNQLSNMTEYDAARDIAFGDVHSEYKFHGYLEPGYFLVCFPEDAHLVGGHVDTEQTVKKVVYKIAL